MPQTRNRGVDAEYLGHVINDELTQIDAPVRVEKVEIEDNPSSLTQTMTLRLTTGMLYHVPMFEGADMIKIARDTARLVAEQVREKLRSKHYFFVDEIRSMSSGAFEKVKMLRKYAYAQAQDADMFRRMKPGDILPLKDSGVPPKSKDSMFWANVRKLYWYRHNKNKNESNGI